MKLTSPATARHRFRCKCYKGGKLLYQFASSAPERHDFEVEDFVDAVQYSIDTVGGQSWVWSNGEWLSGKEGEAKLTPLHKAAGVYAEEFDKRQKAVKRAFKKVTTEL